MTKYRIYFVLALALLVIVAIWLWPSSHLPASSAVAQQVPSPNPTPQSSASGQPTPTPAASPSEEVLRQSNAEGATQEEGKSFLAAFHTPINFWGKVVDENGRPVPNAKVQLGTADRPWETGSRIEQVTDSSGLFSLVGAQGLSISVVVSKDGYHQTSRSRGQISYAQPSGNREPLPTPDNPMVFKLQTMGEAVPLVHIRERTIRIPNNGSPVHVNLSTGQKIEPNQGGLRIECWVNDRSKDTQGRYTWRCRLSVAGGGLIERTDKYAFEAPAEGYRPSLELGPSPDKWSTRAEQQYFVRLPDDRYARIEFRIRTGGENYFVIVSYLNPNPGNRNLEFDPSKVIKSL